MRISESCAKCLYDRQKEKTDNAEYLAEVRTLLENRRESDTSPYMVYLFNKLHVKYFGKGADYSDVKKQYNDLVLGMEEKLRKDATELAALIEQKEIKIGAKTSQTGKIFGSVNTIQIAEALAKAGIDPNDEAAVLAFKEKQAYKIELRREMEKAKEEEKERLRKQREKEEKRKAKEERKNKGKEE